MRIELAAAARIVPFTALMLGGCESPSAYKKLGRQLQAARTRATAQEPEIANLQQERARAEP
jgi:hypothetical protein